MIFYKNNAYNTWSDVVKKYPEMWVVFDKVDVRKGRIQSGNIWTILPDKYIIDFENKNKGKYVLSLRTTETMDIGGYIHGEIVDSSHC